MTRAVPDCAVDFIRREEALRLTAYEDQGHTWTIGWGHCGPEVKPGLMITQRCAELYLKEDLATAAKRLSRVVDEPVILSLTDNQYAALLSFVFNLGCQPSWTIWKVLDQRQYEQVPAELSRFVFVGKTRSQGLANRRAAEVALWRTGEPNTAPETLSSAVTRNLETPPVPGKPALTPAHLIGAGVAAAGGVAEGAKQVSGLIQPFADKSEIVQHALSYAATAGAGAAVVVAGLMYLQHRQAKQ